jgi:hypothetical protein
MTQVAARDAEILFQDRAVLVGIEQPQRRLEHRRVGDGVKRHLLHQLLEPFGQRGLAAAHRAEQVENLFLFFQPLRGVPEIGNDLLDGVLHPVEFLEGGIELEHLVLENARQTRVVAGIDQARFADGLQQPFGGAGIGVRVTLAQFQILVQR